MIFKAIKGDPTHAVKIKQTVTQEGLKIPLDAVQRFQGKQVEIIILPEVEDEAASIAKPRSLKKELTDLFAHYRDVEPYKNLDPLQWERDIRNEW